MEAMSNVDFQKAVIEKSFEKPVVVDFWAEWCGPCRVLGPVIEQLAKEQAARWDLVKINTEEAQELAEQYDIRSIPNVKLFHKGEVISGFAGAYPRHAIEKWLDEFLPSDHKNKLQAILAALKNDGDNVLLIKELEEFVGANPELKEARMHLAKQLVFSDAERAKQLLEDIQLGDEHYEIAEDVRVVSELMALSGNGAQAGQLLTKAQAAIREHQLEAAVQYVIDATVADKNYHNDLPRKVAIALFRLLGNEHPISRAYRWRFDMALY